MLFLVALLVLLSAEFFYFKLADRWNIIDMPNERSSHSYITLRGGGIIFLVAFWAWNLQAGWPYVWASVGLFLIGVVSIWDDIRSLRHRVRLTAHVSGIFLLMLDVGLLHALTPFWLVLVFIVAIGTLNAYNFMDGINGITGIYSLVLLGSMAWVNWEMPFLADQFFIWMVMAVLIFLYFNFRRKAKCFAGDVGSMGIAFSILFAMFLMILETGELKYVLFFSVYGIDTVLTIIQRLYRKENIFKAHRLHLYQLLVNQHQLSHRMVSVFYGLVQLLINTIIVLILPADLSFIIYALIILLPTAALYISLKVYLIKKYAI